MKRLLGPSLLLLLGTLSLAAQAPVPPPPPAQAGPHEGMGRGHRAERLARSLNLSEAQKASIKAIRDKHKAELAQDRDAVQSARSALRTAMKDSATTPAQLRPLFDKAAAARFDLIMAQRATHQEVLAVLSPEQREKAAELRGRMEGRLLGRMEALGRGR